MFRCTHWAAVPILTLAVAVGVGAQGGGKAKAAMTPEEAVKLVEQAFKAGDPYGALDQMAEPSRTVHAAQLEVMMAHEAVSKALDAKFGKDPKAFAGPNVKELLQALKSLQIQSKKARGEGKFDLNVWVKEARQPGKEALFEHTWTAVKQPNGWKLLVPISGGERKKAKRKGADGKEIEVETSDNLPEPSAPEVAFLKTSLPKYKALMEKMTAQVAKGTYKTREAALKALQAAEEEFAKTYPPPKPPESKKTKSGEKK